MDKLLVLVGLYFCITFVFSAPKERPVAAPTVEFSLWKDGIVPYEFSSDYSINNIKVSP
jgi:hypothetical protein